MRDRLTISDAGMVAPQIACAGCRVVPVRVVTWGRVKSLYR
jgi:hypothetical protein